MRYPRLLSATLAAVLLVPFAAAADPISLTYWVKVSERHDLTPPPSHWGWTSIDPIVFQVRLTFDPEITEQRRGETFAVTYFGPATISDVPLVGAGLTSGTPMGRTWVSNFWHVGAEGAAYGTAWIESSGGGSTSRRGVQLFTFDLSPPLAPGEFGTLATYLAAMRSADLRFTFFDYASVWPAGESRPTYAPGSALFGGRAWLVEPEPIPEPATLALVGTGLALAAVRRRRSCRQPRVFP